MTAEDMATSGTSAGVEDAKYVERPHEPPL